jgi:hypothetical protein
LDGELISYQTALLTGANKYSLQYLRRGAYETTIAAHASGAQFARIDQTAVKYAFDASLIGSRVYFKFVSSNIYGGASQDMSTVPSYSYLVTGSGITSPPANVTGFNATVTRGQMSIGWDAVAPVLKYGYEIQHGSVWDAPGNLTVVSKYSGTSYSWTPTISGNIELMIKAINVNGYYSATPTTLFYTVNAPGAVVALSQSSVDNIVNLSWATGTVGTFPLDHYEIWKGATFAGATFLGTKYSTFDLLQETLAGNYTYWVRAVDVAGLAGTLSSVSAVVSQPPDYVLISDQNLNLATATLTNAILENGQIVLPVNTTETWQSHFTTHSWSTPQDQITAGYPLYAQPGMSTSTVSEVVDYGASIPASMITLTPTWSTLAGTVVMTPEILVSPDNVTYTSLGHVYQAAVNTFRYVKYVLVLTTSGGGLASIAQINTTLDVKQKTIMANTLNITDTTGTGTSFTFASLGISPVDVIGITANAPWTNTSADPITALVNFTGTPNPTSFKLIAWDKTDARVAVNGVTVTIRYI